MLAARDCSVVMSWVRISLDESVVRRRRDWGREDGGDEASVVYCVRSMEVNGRNNGREKRWE